MDKTLPTSVYGTAKPSKNIKPFFPRTDADYMLHVFSMRDSNGDIAILCNDVRYIFLGIQSFSELVYAVSFVFVHDCKQTGRPYTRAAMDGKVVYSHISFERVKRWFDAYSKRMGLDDGL